MVEQKPGARWRQESSPTEAQYKISLLGVGSLAKANKTLVLTLLICFSSSGDVLLYQVVQEASKHLTHNKTLPSNFISFKSISVYGFQLVERWPLDPLIDLVFQWHWTAFWGLNSVSVALDSFLRFKHRYVCWVRTRVLVILQDCAPKRVWEKGAVY